MLFGSSADGDAAEVRVADPAVDLATGEDRHLPTVDQTNPAAEVRDDVLIQPQTE